MSIVAEPNCGCEDGMRKEEFRLMFQRLNQTDKVVIIVLGLTLLIFIINAKLGAFTNSVAKIALIALVYLNALCGLSLFLYSSWRFDPDRVLRRSLIIGAIASGTYYFFIDRFFSSFAEWSMRLIIYRGYDSWLFSRFDLAPPSILLNWVCLITIAFYFYLRLRSFFSGVYIPMILTSISTFIGSLLLNELGNLARLWEWNRHPRLVGSELVGSLPFIFSTPLFIPLAIALTFLLSPYLVTNTIAGGIRCAVALCIMQFVCFMIFRYFFI